MDKLKVCVTATELITILAAAATLNDRIVDAKLDKAIKQIQNELEFKDEKNKANI